MQWCFMICVTIIRHATSIFCYSKKVKWLQQDSNTQQLISWTNKQPFNQTGSGWVVDNKSRDCGFETRCSYINLRYLACFPQEVPWHSGNYRVYLHFKTRKCHDKNTQSKRYCFLKNKEFRGIFHEKNKWMYCTLFAIRTKIPIFVQSKLFALNNGSKYI